MVFWNFGISVSLLTVGILVFLGFIVYLGCKRPRDAKTRPRPRSTIKDEKEDKIIRRRNAHTVKSQALVKFEWLKTVIPKVNLQDMEKAEWLNEAIQQAWPTISQYLKKQLLNKTIARGIHITKIDFGGKPVKVHGVKTHKGNEKGQILFYVDISYDGDVEIKVAYFFDVVKRIQLHGIIGVILGPLIDDAPIVGAVTMFFVERPKLTITWIHLAWVLNMGIQYLDTEAMNNIESLVWPKYQTFPQAADLLRNPTD
ncbi:extended synaptotagmin-1-like isoform X2 [Chanodichthys erythropterus]|uniref:extended synaptotagmin-1-like isoform X2 n=1 Tax=Chanodichthys erythropterus TaxID=933992 RepID=UPI00351ED93D